VISKYNSVKNYIWRKTQSKFGKYVSIATLKLLECSLISFYQSLCLLRYEEQTLAFLSIYKIDALYSSLNGIRS